MSLKCSFEDLNNIIWSVCESNMTAYKSDPKSKLKKKKTVASSGG